uniref:Uncharacterized protein n=1 Tax=Kalanchoe fedtschenkoi TaxID=63787 RepID=A0A7N0RCP3_KALFE
MPPYEQLPSNQHSAGCWCKRVLVEGAVRLFQDGGARAADRRIPLAEPQQTHHLSRRPFALVVLDLRVPRSGSPNT